MPSEFRRLYNQKIQGEEYTCLIPLHRVSDDIKKRFQECEELPLEPREKLSRYLTIIKDIDHQMKTKEAIHACEELWTASPYKHDVHLQNEFVLFEEYLFKMKARCINQIDEMKAPQK